MAKLKTLKKSDNVTIVFGEWFDRVNGNTYYDTLVMINGVNVEIPLKYGYNAGGIQSIDEALVSAGYKVRVNKNNRFAPYDNLHIVKTEKLKRDCYK